MAWLLIQHLAVCAALAILVATACRIGRLRPALAHLLWLVVLVRLVVPPVVAWPWSLSELGLSTTIAPDAMPAEGPATSYLDQWEGVTVTPAVPVYSEDGVAPEQRPASVAQRLVASRTALVAWLLGTVSLGAIQAIRLIRFNRRLREQRGAPNWIESEAAGLAQRFGLRAPRVRVVDGIASPLFYGLRRPSILLPAALIDVVPRDRWPGVLAHELAHWKRRDHWVRGLELAAGCVWWWNPVFWFVRHHLRQTAELACDAWVVWALPEGRKTYAKTLVDISEMIALGNQPAAALGIGHGSRKSFERRLSMVMRVNGRANVPVPGLIVAGLVLAISVPILAEAKPRSELATTTVAAQAQLAAAPSPPGEVSEELEGALGSLVSIQFKEEHITRITEFLAEYANTNIVVDHRVVQPAMPFAPGVRLVDTRVPEELGYITDGVISFIKLEDVPLADALNALCEPLGLTYVACPQYIWISTEDLIAKTDFGAPSAEADPEIAEQLKKPLAFEFDDMHIATILEFMGRYVKVDMVLDRDAVPPPEPKPRPSRRLAQPPGPGPWPVPAPGSPEAQALPPVPFPPGPNDEPVAAWLPYKKLTPDGPQLTGLVPYIKLERVDFDEALKALLLPLNLTYKVEPGRIYVTSPKKTF